MKFFHLVTLLIYAKVMHSPRPCWSVGSTPSTRSAATILLVQQKRKLSIFFPKEPQEVCSFSCLNRFYDYYFPSVITRQLCNDKLHRNSQTTVQFTIAAISGASDVAALNMEEVIAQGNDAIGCMKTPRVEAPVTVIQDLQSVLSTWTPLLQNIQRFSDIVHTIAEVGNDLNLSSHD